MKVGDLVELSAYGNKLSYTRIHREKWGIVLERYDYGDLWAVKWFENSGAAYTAWMNRKEIKRLRKE